VVLVGLAPTIALVVAATFIAGLFIGAALPAITAMLGLDTPGEIQGRVFGLSASATALGFGLGPLFAGTIAGVLDVPIALFAMAGFALILRCCLPWPDGSRPNEAHRIRAPGGRAAAQRL
jgi:MFS family permease